MLFLNGEDLRDLPLIERKAWFKRLLRRKKSRIFYVDHIETRGRALFDRACQLDLKGIVAKRTTIAVGLPGDNIAAQSHQVPDFSGQIQLDWRYLETDLNLRLGAVVIVVVIFLVLGSNAWAH